MTSGNTVADQARALGLNIGDTIEGTEGGKDWWNTARLTLLWIGKETCAWSHVYRTPKMRSWSEPVETTDWTLSCREWRKISKEELANEQAPSFELRREFEKILGLANSYGNISQAQVAGRLANAAIEIFAPIQALESPPPAQQKSTGKKLKRGAPPDPVNPGPLWRDMERLFLEGRKGFNYDPPGYAAELRCVAEWIGNKFADFTTEPIYNRIVKAMLEEAERAEAGE